MLPWTPSCSVSDNRIARSSEAALVLEGRIFPHTSRQGLRQRADTRQRFTDTDGYRRDEWTAIHPPHDCMEGLEESLEGRCYDVSLDSLAAHAAHHIIIGFLPVAIQVVFVPV